MKLPNGLRYIIEEKNTRNLRSRQFERNRNWKNDSLSYRLSSRALKEISEITRANSKNGLKNKIQKAIRESYTDNCRTRNCLICNRNMVGNTL